MGSISEESAQHFLLGCLESNILAGNWLPIVFLCCQGILKVRRKTNPTPNLSYITAEKNQYNLHLITS
jgi:hypothetical protein